MKPYQIALITQPCSFDTCNNDAVCGLQNKDNPKIHINVCAKHYTQLTGKPATDIPEEIRLHLREGCNG